MRCLVLILACSLAACTHSPSILKGSGEATDAPVGYTIGCIKNPDAVACKEAAK